MDSNDSNPRKRRKTVKGMKKTGRVRDGEDFWSLVDAWFKDCLERWGDDLNVEEWKR